MKKYIIFISTVMLSLGFSFPTQGNVINVVTTTTDLKSIVDYIGGNKVDVTSLGKGSQNYHFLSAKPSYMIKAKKADLFIRIGLGMEVGYESLILQGSRNANIQVGRDGHLDASAGITPLEIPKQVDRSMGDVHPGGNPHYWLDPMNAKIIAAEITERLTSIRPNEKDYFSSNLTSFRNKIDAKMTEWKETLSPYSGEKIISYHKSWVYFANRFGFEIAGELEPKPGVPPTPTHLKDVIDLVSRQDVKIILLENIYKQDSADFVAEKTKANVVAAPISVGGTKEADDYFKLIDTIVVNIKEGFEQ